MDCSLPGSSVHAIPQARILEWVAMPSSRGIFLTQGLNPRLLCLLHWQVGSLPLAPLGMSKFKLRISTSAVVEIKWINVLKNIYIRVWHTGHPQYILISLHNPLALPFLFPILYGEACPLQRKGKWCFWTVVLEKTLESPLDSEEIQPVRPKGDQSWVHWKDWCWSWNSSTLAT